jgi:hypothetical protein
VSSTLHRHTMDTAHHMWFYPSSGASNPALPGPFSIDSFQTQTPSTPLPHVKKFLDKKGAGRGIRREGEGFEEGMSAKEALLRALALKGAVPDDNLGAWSWKREGRSDKEKYEVCRLMSSSSRPGPD